MDKKDIKKIVFSEEVDSAINGYALSITFISVGLFLLNNLNYFGNSIVSIVILIFFTIIGIAGVFLELSKNKLLKGVDDFGTGAIFFGGWLGIYLFINVTWLNIVSFVALIFGIYGMSLGLIRVVYSILNDAKQSDKRFKKSIVNILKLLPSLASFVLVVFNIIKIIHELKKL